MSSKIDQVYKRLVRNYAYKFHKPLPVLNYDIMKIQSQGKSKERAVLELALQMGFKPREYMLLLNDWHGKSEEEAISEFLRDEVLGISENDSEIKEILREANRSKAEAEHKMEGERPSKAWYLVPLFFAVIGGLIGYVGVKDEDKGMANNLLLFGFLSFFLYVYIVLMVWVY